MSTNSPIFSRMYYINFLFLIMIINNSMIKGVFTSHLTSFEGASCTFYFYFSPEFTVLLHLNQDYRFHDT